MSLFPLTLCRYVIAMVALNCRGEGVAKWPGDLQMHNIMGMV
jgi:hypothetical protein